MLLALDIGNTNITIGVYRDDRLIMLSRMSTDNRRMSDQYAVELRDILDIHGVSVREINGTVICSVVPPLTSSIRNAVQNLTGILPLVVGPGIKTGLNIRIDNPAMLGADFVAGCVAAMAKYPCPAIIFDLGSATTAAVLDSHKNMLGAVITAGIGLSLDALASRTAQLPQIDLEDRCPLIGKNSIDSMRSGALFGTAVTIDGLSRRIENELGQACTVIVTGGYSRLVAPLCERKVFQDDHLLMEGMRLLYLKNHEG